jgi:hypothetical protein
MSDNPLAGELWLDKHNDNYLFITTQKMMISSSLDQEWIWWHNISCNTDGNSSLEYFLNRCIKVNK